MKNVIIISRTPEQLPENVEREFYKEAQNNASLSPLIIEGFVFHLISQEMKKNQIGIYDVCETTYTYNNLFDSIEQGFISKNSEQKNIIIHEELVYDKTTHGVCSHSNSIYTIGEMKMANDGKLYHEDFLQKSEVMNCFLYIYNPSYLVLVKPNFNYPQGKYHTVGENTDCCTIEFLQNPTQNK